MAKTRLRCKLNTVNMIICLTGFMGCGKSSVGRQLSKLLCCPFIDLDEVIVERAGRSIPEIFAEDGEAVFRQMELEALTEVVREGWSKTKSLPRLRRGPLPFTRPRAATVFDTPPSDNTLCQNSTLVLALGGGTVMTPKCAEIVKEQTTCIYLRASVETLIEHLEGQTDNRPLLNLQNCHSDRDCNCHSDRDCNCHSDQNSNCHSDRAKRVEESTTRNRITELMSLRSSTYEKTAHIIIDTDGKSIEAIASEIISLL